nr:hypothetical protein Itr_chr02CG19710 [Ipomoea trifida]
MLNFQIFSKVIVGDGYPEWSTQSGACPGTQDLQPIRETGGISDPDLQRIRETGGISDPSACTSAGGI